MPSDARYASLSLRLRPVVVFVAAFVLVAVVLHVALWLIMGYFARPRMASGVQPMDPATLAAPLQPIPHHAQLSWQDLQAMRAQENQRLMSYGQVGDGFAHIPIDRAMNLLVEQQQATTQEGRKK